VKPGLRVDAEHKRDADEEGEHVFEDVKVGFVFDVPVFVYLVSEEEKGGDERKDWGNSDRERREKTSGEVKGMA
jgi:hypothetical protein